MIKEGQIYRHYKGGWYRIVCVATHAEKGGNLVVYMSADNFKVWAIDLGAFDSTVTIDGKEIKRFKLSE